MRHIRAFTDEHGSEREHFGGVKVGWKRFRPFGGDLGRADNAQLAKRFRSANNQ